MKKITILALHLGYGGIERCISMLGNSLIENYQIEIISTYKLYDKPAFELNPNIQIKYLMENVKPNKQEFLYALKHLHLIQATREYRKAKNILKMKKEKMIDSIKNCDSDIIISTRDIHNEWLGQYGKENIIKIGWEHNHHHNNQNYIKKLVKSVEKLDYFILVSEELKEFYEKKTKCNCIYIPNAIEEIPNQKSEVNEKNIISVGRLSKEKGYSDLIDAFELVHKIYPDWKLQIVGDGSERMNIEKRIEQLQLSESIILHGFQNRQTINDMLLHSSIYVMCSYTESFGIVLLEAFSYGLPCIAYDSAEGARVLISDNWDGYLVKDRNKEQMAKRICELIQNQNRRIIMGNNGRKKAEQYQISEIQTKWISLLEREKK